MFYKGNLTYKPKSQTESPQLKSLYTTYYMHTNITVARQEHITEETKAHKGRRQRKRSLKTRIKCKGYKKDKQKYNITADNNLLWFIYLNGCTIFHHRRSPLGMGSMSTNSHYMKQGKSQPQIKCIQHKTLEKLQSHESNRHLANCFRSIPASNRKAQWIKTGTMIRTGSKVFMFLLCFSRTQDAY